MAKATKNGHPPVSPQRSGQKANSWKAGRFVIWLPVLVIAAAIVGLAAVLSNDGPTQPGVSAEEAKGGLPATPDYHSLLVSPADSDRLFLGTHAGLFESNDGGGTWTQAALVDRDAMNLARTPGETVWAAGHGVLAKSTDAGETWEEVEPPGLPHLDVHGFAADPGNSRRLYAAIAGQGLYRSTDGGASFRRVSKVVGPHVFGLAVTPAGKLLAGDTEKGVFASRDGGTTWTRVLEEAALGIAVNPERANVVLAAGTRGIFRSQDAGRTWKVVLLLPKGGGPLAWSPGEPDVAYAVSFDRTLFRTVDRGATWSAVS